MPKMVTEGDLSNYAPVAERIDVFYATHPNGRIETDLVSRDDGVITFKARVFRDLKDEHPSATGWAAESIGDGEINTFSCLENTETSAIGRALANLGFTASRQRPSLEEIQKVNKERERSRRSERRWPDVTKSISAPGRSAPAPRVTSRSDLVPSDLLPDVLALADRAEIAGVNKQVVDNVRQDLRTPSRTMDDIERAERMLRAAILSLNDLPRADPGASG